VLSPDYIIDSNVLIYLFNLAHQRPETIGDSEIKISVYCLDWQIGGSFNSRGRAKIDEYKN
jgi:hypothetical protein